MLIDAHLHCMGNESGEEVVRTLDGAGVDLGVLLAPFLTDPFSLADRESLRAANAHLGALIADHPDRLVGFAIVNPLHSTAADDLEEAIDRFGLRGLKLVPSGWYPYEERAHLVYQRAASLEIPVLFHSGIFIDGRSGRFCRPVFYEAIRDHPGLSVTLAHLSWPWCDEAIAVGIIDLINGVAPEESQFRFDISFGPPQVYRHEVLRHALEVLGPDLLQFGSDRFLPCSSEHLKTAIEEVEELLEGLEVDATGRSSIFGNTASNWLQLNGSG